jgi:hypothetical protein
VITVARTGQSFIGAHAYFAHDKRREGETERLTSDRLAWTHTRNLPTDDPEKAARIMAFTAMHQQEIKAAAGERLTGRRCRKPVYSLTLAWHPSQDVSKDEMLRAAEGALKALKMENRQAVIYCHTDEPQPHIHIVVNRVDHITGRTADIKRDWYLLSRYAERYERETGRILCELRVNHNERRAQGEFVRNDNLTRREYEIVRLYMRMTPESIRDQRAQQQEADRLQLRDRLHARRQRFEQEQRDLYGAARDRLAAQIADLSRRRDFKGIFASIVRFKQHLTGELAAHERQLKSLQSSLANLDMRMAERRDAFEREMAQEQSKLVNRHRVEVDRDERLIAHARGRAERERMGLKARLGFKLRSDPEQRFIPNPDDHQRLARDLGQAARDAGPGLFDRMAKRLGGDSPDARSTALASDSEGEIASPRAKRWTRKEGRGAHRTPGRKRPPRTRER